MDTAVRTNKTETVRGILKEMGALVKSPPSGWANQVQAKLAEQNLNVSKVRVYQIRTMTMQARKKARSRKSVDESVVKTGRPSKKQSYESAMEHLAKVAEFANSIGGLENLEKTIQILKKIKS